MITRLLQSGRAPRCRRLRATRGGFVLGAVPEDSHTLEARLALGVVVAELRANRAALALSIACRLGFRSLVGRRALEQGRGLLERLDLGLPVLLPRLVVRLDELAAGLDLGQVLDDGGVLGLRRVQILEGFLELLFLVRQVELVRVDVLKE